MAYGLKSLCKTRTICERLSVEVFSFWGIFLSIFAWLSALNGYGLFTGGFRPAVGVGFLEFYIRCTPQVECLSLSFIPCPSCLSFGLPLRLRRFAALRPLNLSLRIPPNPSKYRTAKARAQHRRIPGAASHLSSVQVLSQHGEAGSHSRQTPRYPAGLSAMQISLRFTTKQIFQQ